MSKNEFLVYLFETIDNSVNDCQLTASARFSANMRWKMSITISTAIIRRPIYNIWL